MVERINIEDLKLHDEICRFTSPKSWILPFTFHHGIVTREGNEDKIRITHFNGTNKENSKKLENQTLVEFMDGWPKLYRVIRKNATSLTTEEINDNLIFYDQVYGLLFKNCEIYIITCKYGKRNIWKFRHQSIDLVIPPLIVSSTGFIFRSGYIKSLYFIYFLYLLYLCLNGYKRISVNLSSNFIRINQKDITGRKINKLCKLIIPIFLCIVPFFM